MPSTPTLYVMPNDGTHSPLWMNWNWAAPELKSYWNHSGTDTAKTMRLTASATFRSKA